VGKLRLPVLHDSGSVSSLILFNNFGQLILVDLNIQVLTIDLYCVTASGQRLEIVGQVKVLFTIHGLWWSWFFLVLISL
jgi:hypothetical protein